MNLLNIKNFKEDLSDIIPKYSYGIRRLVFYL